MKVTNSYSQAHSLYKLCSDTSRNWLSRYCGKHDGDFWHIPIERIQAFSQHYFISALIESRLMAGDGQTYEIDNVWQQYPGLQVKNNRSTVAKVGVTSSQGIRRFINLFFLVTATKEKQNIPNGKYSIVIIGSGRHLFELSESIVTLNKKFKVLVVGKIDSETKNKFMKNSVKFVVVEAGLKLLDRRKRLEAILHFWSTPLVFKPIGNKDVLNILKDSRWRSRIVYLKTFLFPEIVARYQFASDLLKSVTPNLLIATSTNDTFGSTFSLAAKKQGIKVAEFQHGFPLWNNDTEYCNCDYFLSWGEDSRKVFAKAAKNHFITGNPFFNSQRRQVKSKPKSKSLLFLWSPAFGSAALYKMEPTRETFSRLIYEFSKFPKDWKIRVRTHPSYNLDAELKHIRLPKNVTVDNSNNLSEEIGNFNVVVTQATTAGLLTIECGKPLFFYETSWFNKRFSNHFVKSGSALDISFKPRGTMYESIINFLADKKKLVRQRQSQQKFVKKALDKTGRDSVKRLSDFCENFV